MTKMIENLKFWIKGKTIYDVHSPFLFEFLNSFLDNSQNFYFFKNLKSNRYSKTTKIKLFKIIRYWNPGKIYLIHPIQAWSLQYLASVKKNLSLIEVNGSMNNFFPHSCFLIDGQIQSTSLISMLNRLSISIQEEVQMVIIINPNQSNQISTDEIDSKYNLLLFTKDFLILFHQPRYKGKRNHFIVSRYTKPWRMGFFN